MSEIVTLYCIKCNEYKYWQSEESGHYCKVCRQEMSVLSTLFWHFLLIQF